MNKIISRIKQLPAGVKASVGFFAASVITSGISYIVTPIYTRLLSAQEYGQTSLFLTWMQIFGIVAMFSFHNAVFNNGMVDYPDKRNEYSFSILVLSNIITVCFSAVLLCVYPFIKNIIGLEFKFIVLMCVIFMVQPAYNFWIARQRYELKYKPTLFWTAVVTVVSQLSAIVCILLVPDNRLYGRIFGMEIAIICIHSMFYIYLAKKSNFKADRSYWKGAFKFNLPLIPHYLSIYLLGNSNKIMISRLVNDTATAYYSVAHSIASIAIIVWSAVNASLIPHTYEKCKVKDYASISKVVTPLLTFFAGVCVLVIMFAPEVVRIMATEEYMEAIYVIPPIIGGVFFQVQYYVYANIVFYYKKPKYVMYASVTATFVNIILNYILISKFGYLAAGYTTLICYMLQAVLNYLAMRKVVKEKIYDIKYICVLSACVLGVAILSNLIYDSMVIRYSVIALVVAVIIIFREKVINLFINMKKKK